MNEFEILQLTCLKHIKIYGLHLNGLKNTEIAKLCGTNAGHVYNVLKSYKDNPEKIEKANALFIER